MLRKVKVFKKNKVAVLTALTALIVVALIVVNQLSQSRFSDEDFAAPTRSWDSPKKVEDYFVEKLRFTEKDLELHKDRLAQGDEISFYVTDNSTLDGIVSNLYYYGFVRSEEAFRYALEYTKDTTSGNESAIEVGNGSIDVNAYYEISEDMPAWEIAETLLNNPNYFGSHGDYGNLFMP